MYYLLGQRASEGLVIEEVGLDLEQQSSHFKRLGEEGDTCEMKLEELMEHGTRTRRSGD